MNGIILLLCSIWGFNWVMMEIGGSYFPPMMFSALRFLVGSFVLFLIIWHKRIPLPKKEDWKWYTLCGILQTAYIYTISQYALKYIDPGVACVLSFTMPLWLTIMAPFFIPEEKLTKLKTIGVLLGIGGLFMVMEINPAQLKENGIKLGMELLLLSGAFAWASANIIIKKFLHSNDKIQFTGYQMAIGALFLLLGSFFFEQGEPVIWNGKGVTAILFAGVIASSLAYVLWFHILTRIDASKASISLLLVPVVGVISSWLFFQTELSWSAILGIFLILSGIGLVNVNPKNREERISAFE